MAEKSITEALKSGAVSDFATSGVLKQLNEKTFGPEMSALRESVERANALSRTALRFDQLATSPFLKEMERMQRFGSAFDSLKLGATVEAMNKMTRTALGPDWSRTMAGIWGTSGVSFHLNNSATAAFQKEAERLRRLTSDFEGLKLGASFQVLKGFSGRFDESELGSTMKRLREMSAWAERVHAPAIGAALERIQRLTFCIDPAIIEQARARLEQLPPGAEQDELEEDLERLAAAPEELAAARNIEGLSVQVSEINAELIEWLEKHPEKMRELPPRKFEELIAELFKNRGCEVQLTPQTRDGGFDIFLTIPTPFGTHFGIVECKRNAARRKIDVAIVERFIHTVREKMKANVGFIAATTTFSPDAMKEAAVYKHQLRLLDFAKIKEMVSQYGKWHQSASSSLWLPNN